MQVTKSSIIEGLYKSKDFNDCINKQEPADLRDDLRQDIIIIVMELPEDKLIALYLNKTLVYYVAKIISNQVRNPRNAFHKTYRNEYEEITNQAADDFEIEERQIREAMEDLALSEVDKLHWYNKELVEMYIQLGNYRAIQTATGIPFGSCYKTIKKSLHMVKCNVMQIDKVVPTKVALGVNESAMAIAEGIKNVKQIIEPVIVNTPAN